MRLSRAAVIPAIALLAACSDPSAKSHAQPAPGLPAPTRAPPGSAAAMKMSFAPVVKKAAPAVVNVSSRRVVRQRSDPFFDFFMGGGMPRDRVESSLGSGAIIRADGVIVTNHHVIEGMTEIAVQLADRREFPATVLLDDARSDLAVLKIDTKGERLPTLAIDDQEAVQVGDLVLAIGNPFGVGQTVTNGIVSATQRTDVGITDYSSFIQTDAAINPGNSGGPLVDMDGDLIGLNTAIFSRSGSSSGVGFAIPAAMVKQVVNAALGGGHSVVRPWLGAKAQPVSADMARSLGMTGPRGVIIAQVWNGSSAARAGLKEGDIVLAIDGQPVNDEAGLTYGFATKQIGQAVTLTIRRNEREQALNLRAESAPSIPAADERTLGGQTPLSGATVINLSPAKAEALGVDPFSGPGVLVSKIDGLAARAGFQAGDFIRAVNGKATPSVRDLAAALATPSRGWAIDVERGGEKGTLRF
jgi:Do/DeqQ family serine protease